ncbi:hypothetical protein IQ07DRAFT_177414 [Pyrenochaeta sp. DS3sAY3a]|nr:hypothetical protein IQ07DRAFT_177414 [Pyrenochaeta sp. DS3sAY3a]
MAPTAPPDLFLAVIIIVGGVLVFILVFLMLRRSTRLRGLDPEIGAEPGTPSQAKRLSHRFSRRFSRRFSHLHVEHEHQRDLSPRQRLSPKPPAVELNPVVKEIRAKTDKPVVKDEQKGKNEIQRPHEEQGLKMIAASAHVLASIKDIESQSNWSGGTVTEDKSVANSMNLVDYKKDDM